MRGTYVGAIAALIFSLWIGINNREHIITSSRAIYTLATMPKSDIDNFFAACESLVLER